jgi:3',5'-cyclic AMP phosphodiesterase CpdA
MPLTIMVMADPQFGIFAHQAKKAADEAAGRGAQSPVELEHYTSWEREARLFAQAIAEANRLRPDLVMVCGDMVMQWDSDAQAQAVKAVAGGLDPSIPLRWVPGNHDVGVDFFAPTPESLTRYREVYGDDYYGFSAGPARITVINSPLFDRPELAPGEYERQLRWLRDELTGPQAAEASHRIVFSHHPPFVDSPDEANDVYNIPLERRQVLLALLAEAGVSAIFAGHTHLNVLAAHNGLQVVASASTGYNRNGQLPGYRLVQVSGEAIAHTFHTIEESAL